MLITHTDRFQCRYKASVDGTSSAGEPAYTQQVDRIVSSQILCCSSGSVDGSLKLLYSDYSVWYVNASKCALKYMVPTSLAKDKNPKCCMLGVISPSEPVYSGPHIKAACWKKVFREETLSKSFGLFMH